MKRKLCLLISFIYISTIIIAQNGNSIYSSFGIGNILPTAVGQQEGLGYTGIGLQSPFFVNTSNPAANAHMQLPVTMLLDVGLNMDLNHIRSQNERTNKLGGGLSHLVMWLQPNRHWGTTIGLLPISEVSYNVYANRYDGATQSAYQIVYQGSGGTYKFYWGNAFAITKNLSVGANVAVLIGAINRTESFNSASVLTNFTTQSKTNLLGVQVDAGAQYKFQLGSNQFVLGATFTPGSKLNSSQNILLQSAAGEEIEQTINSNGTYRFPLQMGAGLSWSGKQLTIASDVSFQQWSDADLNAEEGLQNTVKWMVGAEWAPIGDSYFYYPRTWFVRSGFFVQNYHQTVNGSTFPVWGLTAGVSIPIPRKFHHISFNYAFQSRGTLSNDLLLESRHRISASINLRDIWFQKRKIN